MATLKKQLLINLDPDLHRQARIKAVADGVTLADILRNYLAKWVEGSNEQANKNGQEKT